MDAPARTLRAELMRACFLVGRIYDGLDDLMLCWITALDRLRNARKTCFVPASSLLAARGGSRSTCSTLAAPTAPIRETLQKLTTLARGVNAQELMDAANR